jgi:hypothetical protein
MYKIIFLFTVTVCVKMSLQMLGISDVFHEVVEEKMKTLYPFTEM